MRWTEVVARVGISSLLLPALLISSLLSFPSSCRCGAELPHVHGLFSLAGHSHTGTGTGTGADASSVGDPGHPHANDPGHLHDDIVTDATPLRVERDLTAAAWLHVDTTQQAGSATRVANSLDVDGHAPGMTPDTLAGSDTSVQVQVQVQVQAPGSAPVAPGLGLPVSVTMASATAQASELHAAAEQILVGRDMLPDTPPPQHRSLA